MYHHCIHCSADLGSNESIETFPVGQRLAFDAWQGRLWVVCRSCGRWNLTPLEERWEAVEACERIFRDSRLRVQRENIGLTRLADGTRLIRIGEALPGEIAAWRYGGTLLRRRNAYLVGFAALGVAGAAWLGLYAAGALAGGTAGLLNIGTLAWQYREAQRLFVRIPANLSPTGKAIDLHRFKLNGARLMTDADGRTVLRLPRALELEPRRSRVGVTVWESDPLDLGGEAARIVLSRAMPAVNEKGATRRDLGRALTLLDEAGSASSFMNQIAERTSIVGVPHVPEFHRNVSLGAWRRFTGALLRAEVEAPRHPNRAEVRKLLLPRPARLALEMALNEDRERRALEGELAELRAAWKLAEEIAQIADGL